MGQEIFKVNFSQKDKDIFHEKLKDETRLLKQQIEKDKISKKPAMVGFEIEACLLDTNYLPNPISHLLLPKINNPLVVEELAKFNIEINNTPLLLQKNCLQKLSNELSKIFKQSDKTAEQLKSKITTIGILPTIKIDDCCIENMSEKNRYLALNKQLLNNRKNKKIKLDIQGKQHLKLICDSIMLESATTSFQIHLQVPFDKAHIFYNASLIASTFTVAAAANSPFLFGKQLWQESRIPLFEQSVVGNEKFARVTFGDGYIDNIFELFSQNLQRYQPLLPFIMPGESKKFSHLRLHNGTIWRWNRPLVGFDEDGTPHFRIEHRVLPAGPTIDDMLANAIFYYGLTYAFSDTKVFNQADFKFSQIRNNFYKAAKHGLVAKINWPRSKQTIKSIILNELLPLCHSAALQLNIDKDDVDYYLNIIKKRVQNEQTGANWQINHSQKIGANMQQLCQDYYKNQQTKQPVHTWKK